LSFRQRFRGARGITLLLPFHQRSFKSLPVIARECLPRPRQSAFNPSSLLSFPNACIGNPFPQVIHQESFPSPFHGNECERASIRTPRADCTKLYLVQLESTRNQKGQGGGYHISVIPVQTGIHSVFPPAIHQESFPSPFHGNECERASIRTPRADCTKLYLVQLESTRNQKGQGGGYHISVIPVQTGIHSVFRQQSIKSFSVIAREHIPQPRQSRAPRAQEIEVAAHCHYHPSRFWCLQTPNALRS